VLSATLGHILQVPVEVYKRETREIIRRFLIHNLSFPSCIAALDAALAGLLPRLQPDQIEKVRAVMLANNEQVMEEMARRSKKARRTKHGAKHLYVDCKECGHKITLQVHTGDAGDPLNENLTCPDCLKESAYSLDDFKTAELF
jgi:predicted Zn-ribbon and HTH transcriptional regulator